MSELLDTVTEIDIYPIKSCQTATVDQEFPSALEVGPAGFEAHGVRDRDFVIVDTALWSKVTQRGWGVWDKSKAVVHPEDRVLATVQVDIRPDHLEVFTPQYGRIEIGTQRDDSGDQPLELDIFGKDFYCTDQGEAPSAYFTKLLGRAVRLVRTHSGTPRLISEYYRLPEAANMMAGADGAPFLLVNQASLDESHRVNGFEPGALPIDRFRGNITIDGAATGPYGEDYLRKIKIGNLTAYVVKACSRCPIPNTDQATGEFTPKVGLNVIRGRKGVIATGEKGTFFGQNLNHVWVPGQTVSVGDNLRAVTVSPIRNVQLAA